MRIGTHNVAAILVAALAVFAIGFLTYAVVFAEQWQAWTGITEEVATQANQPWRMALMPVMPLLTAIGMSFVVGWRGVRTAGGGAVTGLIVGVFLAVGTRLYGLAYSFEPVPLFALDSAHLLVNCIVAGAIVGAMR